MSVASETSFSKTSTTKSQAVPTYTKQATENRNVARYETTAVYTHPDAEVDIVLVHGLNGRPDLTWTAANGTFWPTDLLPAALRGVPANVLVYGYNADVYSRHHDRSASDNFIHQHAQTLVTNLALFRRGEGRARNPLVWVAHSLGGVLVKRALLYAHDVRDAHHDDYRAVYVSTYGIVFLGTPHTGAGAATWGCALQAMSDAVLPRKLFESESVLLKTLKKDNETLANINSHFLDIYQRFRIHMVHENHKTDLKGTKMLIVDAGSASPPLPGVTYYGVEATHSRMCKFDAPTAPGFRALSTDVRQWVLDAPALIRQRWAAEDAERAARLHCDISERMATPPPAAFASSGMDEVVPSSVAASPAPPYSALAAPPPAYEQFAATQPPPRYTPAAPVPAATTAVPTSTDACHCCCRGLSLSTTASQKEQVAAVVRGITAAASLACDAAEAVVGGLADLASTVRGACRAAPGSERQGDTLFPQPKALNALDTGQAAHRVLRAGC
ncbi:and NB-ARC domain [Cordyceps militaris]|uniref:And NB-ARC domain n=1 Tax=Cordyceps militaris TaxID=73501 RepID=A0A2H4STR2_CORMI|nr:and NB-ARC domain [Cordyceps militaris]